MDIEKELDIKNWSMINWKQVSQVVFNTQKKIWEASSVGNLRLLRSLQIKAFNSWSFKLLAVKQVTHKAFLQNIAGIKYKTYIPNEYKLELTKTLIIDGTSINLMKIDINQNNLPKIIHDSALQMLVKMIIEPEWDAKLEDNVYGDRAGYTVHDAIYQICLLTNRHQNYNYIIHGHLKKKDNGVKVNYLLKKSNYLGLIAKQIKAWIECDWLEVDQFFTNIFPKKRKGIIGPILNNMLIHGLEWHLEGKFGVAPKCSISSKLLESTASFKIIRFLDQIIIILKQIDEVNSIVKEINLFLDYSGLEINKDTTELAHIEKGFDFLGFSIRRFRDQSKPYITPSQESMKNHYLNLRSALYHKQEGKLRATTNKALEDVIADLNPIITSWSLYYKDFIPSDIFRSLDWKLSNTIYRWFKKKVKSVNTLAKWKKGCQVVLNGRQRIGTNFNSVLILHSSFKYSNYTPPPYGKSFYDGDYVYWSTRSNFISSNVLNTIQ
uniref:putative reverse transcriptase/maturase n=1 Tax=Erythrolobus coxiae TaxID=362235 RepID=UPI001FCD0A77|nr:putative reverse transcriptase/maturase [Erythrolobus coxiae]UNJ17732.1 putative reverse transcriptase/maturase [Erythrolobus coxiae]